jgi:hypothetical protein
MRIATTAILLLSLASHRALAQGSVVIAVDSTVPGDKNPAAFRSAVASRALAGFESFSLKLNALTEPKVIEMARSCEDQACLQDVAGSLDLALAVQVKVIAKRTGKRGKLDYNISMLAARAKPDQNAWREKTECSDCDAEDAKQQVYLLAGTVAERIKGESKSPAGPPPLAGVPATPPLTAPAAAPPPTMYYLPPPVPPLEQKPGWYVPRYVSIPVLIGGAAALGAGIYLLAVNGKGTCDLAPGKRQCQDRYATGVLGGSLTAVGAVAVIGGFVGLFFFPPGHGAANVAVGFDGTSISVAGVF